MSVAVEPKRRKVSDDEIRQAIQDTNNANIISEVTRLFSAQLDSDTLESCGLHGLWRCLGYHREGHGKKFTTNLYTFVQRECLRELQRKKRGFQTVSIHETNEERVVRKPEKANWDDINHIRECMAQLPDEQRKLIEQHYMQGLNITEIANANLYTKETARQNLGTAFETLKQICRSSLGEPV